MVIVLLLPLWCYECVSNWIKNDMIIRLLMNPLIPIIWQDNHVKQQKKQTKHCSGYITHIGAGVLGSFQFSSQ